MRWRTFWMLLAINVAAIGYWAYQAKPAKCAYCFAGQCINNSICAPQGCVCMKRGTSPVGECVSLGR